jgi:hypothetical protein
MEDERRRSRVIRYAEGTMARGPSAVSATARALTALVCGACGSAFSAGGGDASTGDAAVDAPPDSGVDTGADAAPPGDAEAGTMDFCAGMHAFCDDFDHGLLSDKWKPDSPCAIGVLDPTHYVSSPNSLLSAVTATSGCVRSRATVPPFQVMRCDFELRVDVLAPMYLEVFRLVVRSATVDYYQVAVGFDPTQMPVGLLSEDLPKGDAAPSSRGLPVAFDATLLGKWFHAHLSIDLNNGTATASLGGVDTSLTLQYAPAPPPTGLEIRAGASTAAAVKLSVNHDNVICDGQ